LLSGFVGLVSMLQEATATVLPQTMHLVRWFTCQVHCVIDVVQSQMLIRKLKCCVNVR
jgi:hypothetical protein